MEGIDWLRLAVSFGGGVLGAAIGGLNAFTLCGLAAIVGSMLVLSGGDSAFNEVVTWGPFLGPHVAFSGGVAAAAAAARQGKLKSGREVLTALMGIGSPWILVIGGLFGFLGEILKSGVEALPPFAGLPWTNSIALSIVLNGLLVRLLFGRSGLFGRAPEGTHRWRSGERLVWLPWQSKPGQLILLAIAITLPAGYVVKALPGSSGLVFGFSAFSLVFFQFGARVPVTLHMALSAEMIVLATGDLLWGVVFGLLAAFFAEFSSRVFLIFGDTHIDPPAISLVLTYALFPLLLALGLL